MGQAKERAGLIFSDRNRGKDSKWPSVDHISMFKILLVWDTFAALSQNADLPGKFS